LDIVSLINKPNPVIFDIGCNDGNDTARFCKMFPNGRIYAFEPDPRAINKFKSRKLPVSLFEGVISDINGDILFHQSAADPKLVPEGYNVGTVDPNWDKSGSILKPSKHLEVAPWVTFPTNITVKSITLDTFTEENNIDLIDFIWADVQGTEERMIIGGRNTFDHKVKYLYTEYSLDLYEGSPTMERILELLPSYELVELFEPTIHGGDMLLVNKELE